MTTGRKIGGGAIALLALIIVGFFAVYGIRIMRVQTIQKQVSENVFVGASPDVVIHYLDSQRLEHSELIRPEAMSMGGKRYDATLVIVAIKRRTLQSLLVREDVQLVFVFGENHELVRTDIFPVYTGL